MIRNDSEYREALRRIESERLSLAEYEAKLSGMGFSPEEVARGIAPLRTFHQQFVEKAEAYANAKRGDLSGFRELRDIGRLLVACRIASGLSQRAFAERLGVNESQVSRDERNEYNNITLSRACEILDSFDVEAHVKCVSKHRQQPTVDLEFSLPSVSHPKAGPSPNASNSR